jgi:hypothetical protein
MPQPTLAQARAGYQVVTLSVVFVALARWVEVVAWARVRERHPADRRDDELRMPERSNLRRSRSTDARDIESG